MPFKSNTINLRLHRPAAPSEESATSTAKVASSIALSCYYSTNGTPLSQPVRAASSPIGEPRMSNLQGR